MIPISPEERMTVLLRVGLEGLLPNKPYILLMNYPLPSKCGRILEKPFHKMLRIENDLLLQNYITC